MEAPHGVDRARFMFLIVRKNLARWSDFSELGEFGRSSTINGSCKLAVKQDWCRKGPDVNATDSLSS